MTNPKKTCYEGKIASPSIALKAFSAVGLVSLVALSITIWMIKGF